MNYRHAFHAGNFADVAKHAILLAVLTALKPERVLDTHAGAGLYDLGGEDARRTGEAQTGVARLMEAADAPSVFGPLKAAVRRANPDGGLRWYPGSPRLAVDALASGASYAGFELQPDAHAQLVEALRGSTRGVRVETPRVDGYAEAVRRLAQSAARTLLLVDPPFERADDYERILELTGGLRRTPGVGALIWLPLKDLETFDAFLSRLEAQEPASLCAAQVRVRPLDDPMRMNGCALVAVNLPDVDAQAREACGWVAGRLGGPGALGRVERLAG
ncbi:MAG: 23S rRNA (adenine(2030)-N(6))-methyltransferase RlmJ [Caulobacteraceae bacterium]